MVKFQHFGLFAVVFCLLWANVSLSYASSGNGFNPAEQCNLPAPDSFRIIQTGGEFIELAWKPIFPGATHQLTIMESDGAGGYVTILEETNVPGDTYRANDLLPGTGYRFILATKCPSGDPSEIKTIFDGITLIVDLVIGGRKPVNPIPLGTCEYIPKDFNWVGFSVSSTTGEEYIQNFFEIKPGGVQTNQLGLIPYAVMRYEIEHPIVAVDDEGIWPTCEQPHIKDDNGIFRVDRLIGGGPNREIIGYVSLVQNDNPPSYYICPQFDHPIYPWKSNYLFSPLVSTKAGPPQICTGRNVVKSMGVRLSQTIFSDNIFIVLDEYQPMEVSCQVLIFDEIGRTVFRQNIENCTNLIQLNTTHIPSGYYFIKVISQHEQKTFKAVKHN